MLNIVIFGAPGSGKGTQSTKISEKYALEHISTGDMLRAEIKANTEFGKKANSYISKGHLIPDEVMIDKLDDLMKKKNGVKGFIFDGFPRTIAQGKALDEMLEKYDEKVTVVLSLEVEEDELVDRILKRGEISGRSDDNRETVEARLNVYHNQTEPLKNYYSEQFKLVRIPGQGTIDEVFESISTVLDRIIGLIHNLLKIFIEMAETNFVDYVKIFCRSGKGGRGSAHFRREKYIPKGGPDGGDGGDGGSVILRGNRNYWTLLHLRYQRHIFAGHGEPGGGAQRSGKKGESKIIDVPCGTVAYDAHTGEFLCDITDDGQEVTLLKGGRGGLGNQHFKTATNQAPRYAQPGEPHEERWVILELKLLADVGLVGFPNAGKSTLLSVVSAAKPKIDNYPFTTLEPNLGIVEYREGKSFVMADIPGIIEGASEGRGLGLRFLRHIERNSLLLFVIPADSKDIKEEYYILLNELKKYNPEMLDKSHILAISKSDMLDEELMDAITEELPDLPYVFISSVTGFGIQHLKDVLWRELNSENYIPITVSRESLVHRNLDISQLEFEPEEDFEDEDDDDMFYDEDDF
jgi:GTP-binding protein